MSAGEFTDPVSGIRYVFGSGYAAGFGGRAEYERYGVGMALLAFDAQGKRLPAKDVRVAFADCGRFADAASTQRHKAGITESNIRYNESID